MFYVKLVIHSIHSCIHHHLDPNTEKDMDWMVPRLLLHALLLVAYQLITSISSTVFIQPMQTCIQHEAVGLLYSFMHSVSIVFKYCQRHGPNSLQATTRAHCSTPTNNVHHTQKYSNDACKSVFRSKRILSSIHWCIHHDLYSDIKYTRRDMTRMMSSTHHHHYDAVSYKHMDTNKVEPNSFERFNFDQISPYCVNSYM